MVAMGERMKQVLLDASNRDACAVGHEYLRNWAWLAVEDTGVPRLKPPTIHYSDTRWPDPEGVERRHKRWVAEQAYSFVHAYIESLDPQTQAIILASYLRVMRQHNGNASWLKHIRKWKQEEIAESLGVPRRTYFHQIAAVRRGLAEAAELAGIPLPP